ncbi:hypothetical protein HDU93_005599, partial [Gonapodya sp. JEL0774]
MWPIYIDIAREYRRNKLNGTQVLGRPYAMDIGTNHLSSRVATGGRSGGGDISNVGKLNLLHIAGAGYEQLDYLHSVPVVLKLLGVNQIGSVHLSNLQALGKVLALKMRMSTKAEYIVAIASTLVGCGYMQQKDTGTEDGEADPAIRTITTTEILKPTQCQSIVEQMRTLKVEMKDKQEKKSAEKKRKAAQGAALEEGRPSRIHKK